MRRKGSKDDGEFDVSIAVGIPVFKRTEALRQCLHSISGDVVDRVIIADDGCTKNRHSLYSQDRDFEQTVIDIDYDSGAGVCRSAISEELQEDYLLVIDCDMALPVTKDVLTLIAVLESQSHLGAVSGILAEGNRIRSGCTNFYEESLLFGGRALIESIRKKPHIEWINDSIPIALFDKLPNAALIRRECIEEYSWDPKYPIGEHVDFYIGHYHKTAWDFAVVPTIVFNHQKKVNMNYRSSIRSDSDRHQRNIRLANRIGQKKWGYDRIVSGGKKEWFDTAEPSMLNASCQLLSQRIPIKYLLPIKDLVRHIRSIFSNY